MCAEHNLTVAQPSTPASHFHLLRRQAHEKPRRPLVVFTPKSMLRLKAARRWNFIPQTIAYQGYGSTTWVRVLGRVVLTSKAKPGSPAEQAAQNGNQNVRGWRAFTSVPIQFTEVEIEIGGVTARVHADRGGLVDAVVQVSLAPGWHTAELRAEGRTADAEALTPLADQPTATWIATPDNPYPAVEEISLAAAAEDELPVLVAYNVPGRDCGSYSAGGAAGVDAYLSWVGSFAAALGDRPAGLQRRVLVLAGRPGDRRVRRRRAHGGPRAPAQRHVQPRARRR